MITEEDLQKIKALRKTLHSMPEKSGEEIKTKACLMAFLKENTSLQTEDRGSYFFVYAKAPGAKMPPVAFRADMDAVCAHDGKPGHFCGHDGHSSILSGLALILDKEKEKLSRDVYLIFQPAEETGEGAAVCRELIKEKNIERIYGLHNIPGYPEKTVLFKKGTFACASTGLEIRMTGTPSHAAYPEAGKNPGTALAELLLSIEALTKKIREQESFVLMTLIGMEIGSESYGVSASDGVLRLTVRGEKESVFSRYLEEIRRLADEKAGAGGFTLQMKEIERFPATENHTECVEAVERAAKELGLATEELAVPMRWSEDFGYYLQDTKGAFFGIGDGEEHAQLHTEHFEFPDSILPAAVALFEKLLFL